MDALANTGTRRAKIKLIAKKSIESGEDCDGIPESMRNYLAMQAMESGKSLGGNFLGRSSMMPYGNGQMGMGADHQGKVGMCYLPWLTSKPLLMRVQSSTTFPVVL